MSPTVDKRLVELGFDNKQFESGVQDSVKTLDTLKKGLNLDAAAGSLSRLSTAGNSFSLGGIGDTIGAVTSNFSVLGVVGFTVLQNITNSAIQAGTALWNGLMVDPIKMGLSEYETQMGAIQTILANTSADNTNLDQVNAALLELNNYSDKTIYNFTEMARNIGTFTAAGIKLDTSVSAIKGIANLAAVSGSNAQQASTAMYQLSQAMASGTVKLMDWNSVVNAGMGGKVFQTALTNTARKHGVAIDEMIKKEGSFRETLSKGWLTTAVLTETLSTFTGDLTEAQLKAMGYTEKESQAIIEQGKMANDAATKVKTMSQLWDTLKEAAQSGWGQSWQLVVGDFEEAKALMTEISNVVGGMIGAYSAARNSMLQKWKDNGGRVKMIDAMRNAFEGVVHIVTLFKDAFEEIFPPITGRQLADISIQLEVLSRNFKMGAETSDKVKRIFKGLFAAVDILAQPFIALGKGVGQLLGVITPAGGGLLDFAANLGDYLMNLRDSIKSSDIFGKAVTNIGFVLGGAVLAIKNFASGVAVAFSTFKTSLMQNGLFIVISDKIKEFVQKIKDSFASFKNMDMSGFTDFVNKVKERFSPLGQVLEGIGTILSKFGEVIKTIWTKISPIFGKIGDFMGTVLSKIKEGILGGLDKLGETISNIDYNKFFDGLNAGLMAGLIYAINKFINKGASAFDAPKGIVETLTSFADKYKAVLDGITGVLSGVRDTLKTYQDSLKADILQKIAIAIGILTVSLIALSLIDSKKLAASLGAMTVMFADLFGSITIFEKANKDNTMGILTKTVVGLIGASIAITILSVALAKLASLDSYQMIQGVLGIAALSVVIAALTKVLSENSGEILSTSIGLTVFGVALNVMASAVERLGKMKFNDLLKGLGGVFVLCTELSLLMKLKNVDKLGFDVGVGLLAMSVSVGILAMSVSAFGNMPLEKLTQGIGALGAVMIELGVFLRIAQGNSLLISTSIGLVIVAGSMLLFAKSIEQLGNLSLDQIAKGLVTMAGALGIIGVAMAGMPVNMLLNSVALGVVAGSILLLANALTVMGNMSVDQMKVSLGTLAISLGLLAFGLSLMVEALPGAAAMLVVSIALAIFAPALKVLGDMPLANIGAALLAIAGIFVILGVAGLVLTPVLPVLFGLAAVIGLLGLAALAAGIGVAAFAVGLTALSIAGAAGTAAMIVLVTALIKLLPMMGEEIGKAVISFATTIKDGAPAIKSAITTVLLNMIQTVVDTVPKFVEALGILLVALFNTLANAVPKMVDAGLQLIVGLLKGIAKNIGQIIKAGIDIVVNFLKGISSKIGDVTEAAFELVIAFTNGLSNSIDAHSQELTDAGIRLAESIIKAMAYGISQGVGAITEALWNVIQQAIANFLNPPKDGDNNDEAEKAGAKVVNGLSSGLLNAASLIQSAASTLGTEALDSFTGAMSNIGSILLDSIDTNPTIRPVLDLTDLLTGSDQIDRLFSKRSFALSVPMDNLPNMASSSQNVNTSQNQTGSGSTSLQLIQNNYSPKALSTIEIYRQTKNQISLLKGLTNK